MSKGDPIPPLPADAPKAGEVYAHYKSGDLYKVTALALHSNDDVWMIVYEPMYANAAAPMFTRPLSEWQGEVEWEGQTVARFLKT